MLAEKFSSLDELNSWFRSLSKDEKGANGVKYNEWKGRLKERKQITTAPQFKTDPVGWLRQNIEQVASYKIHDHGEGEVEAHAEVVVETASDPSGETRLRDLAAGRFDYRYSDGLLLQSLMTKTKSRWPNYNSQMLTVTEWRR